MRLLKIYFLLLILLTNFNFLSADIFNVSSIEELKSALDEAKNNNENDIIQVSAGTYVFSEAILFSYTKKESITIRAISSNTSDEVVFDGGNSFGIFDIESLGEFIFENIKFQNSSRAVKLKNTVATFKNSRFEQNIATESGGAIYLEDSTRLSIFDSNFSNNQANTGGAIFASINQPVEKFKIEIKNSNFLDNNNSAIYIRTLQEQIKTIAEIENSNFLRNKSTQNGGAISLNEGKSLNSELYISSWTITDSTFEQNSATESGGAIYLYGSMDLNLNDSTFKNNSANILGGANNFLGVKRANINKSLFESNIANQKGGAIYFEQQTTVIKESQILIEDSTFNSNKAGQNSEGFGGAVTIYNIPKVEVKNSTFSQNSSGIGAGLFIRDGIITDDSELQTTSVSIENSKFNNNEISNYGGGIYLYGYKNLEIKESEFNDNNYISVAGKKSYGAGLHLDNVINVDISNSEFNRNSVANNGGAIYLRHYSDITDLLESKEASLNISFSSFLQNIASENGGAVVVIVEDERFNLDVTTTHSKFLQNSSTANGGSYYIEYKRNGNIAKQVSQILFDEVLFENSTSNAEGGAVLLDGFCDLNIENSTFKNNTSSASKGGALSVKNTQTVNIKNSTFTENTALSHGGAISTTSLTEEESSMNIENSSFYKNSTTLADGNDVGGAIFLGVAELDEVTFNFNASDSNFTENKCSNGGAIFLSSKQDNSEKSYINVKDSIFHKNSASQSGGALFFTSYADTNIIGNTFSENSATAVGSVAYIQNVNNDSKKPSINISDSIVRNNSGVRSGTFNVESTGVISIADSLFTENSSQKSGAAFYLAVNEIEIDKVTITSNTLTNAELGTSIYIEYSESNKIYPSVLISNSEIKNNIGNKYGNVFIRAGKGIIIFNTIFSGNSTEHGGGILFHNDVATAENIFVINSTFYKNTATVDGAGIFNNSTATLYVVNSAFNSNNGKQIASPKGALKLINSDADLTRISATNNFSAEAINTFTSPCSSYDDYGYVTNKSSILDSGISIFSIKDEFENKDILEKLINIFDENGLDKISSFPIGLLKSSSVEHKIDNLTNKTIDIYTMKPLNFSGTSAFSSTVAGLRLINEQQGNQDGLDYGKLNIETNTVCIDTSSISAKSVYDPDNVNVRYKIVDIIGGRSSEGIFTSSTSPKDTSRLNKNCYGSEDECKLSGYLSYEYVANATHLNDSLEYKWEKQYRINLKNVSSENADIPMLRVTRPRDYEYTQFSVPKINTKFTFEKLRINEPISGNWITNQTLLTIGSKDGKANNHLQIYAEKREVPHTKTEKLEFHTTTAKGVNYQISYAGRTFDLNETFDLKSAEKSSEADSITDLKTTITNILTGQGYSFKELTNVKSTMREEDKVTTTYTYDYYLHFYQKGIDGEQELTSIKIDEADAQQLTNNSDSKFEFWFEKSSNSITVKFQIDNSSIYSGSFVLEGSLANWSNNDFIGDLSPLKKLSPSIGLSTTIDVVNANSDYTFNVTLNGQEVPYHKIENEDQEYTMSGFGEYWISEGDEVELLIPVNEENDILVLDKLNFTDSSKNISEININDRITIDGKTYYWINISSSMGADSVGEFNLQYNLKTYQFETEIGKPFNLNYGKINTNPDLSDNRKVTEQVPDFLLEAINGSHQPTMTTPVSDYPADSVSSNIYVYTTRMLEPTNASSEEIDVNRELYIGNIYFTRPGKYLLEWFVDSDKVPFNSEEGSPKLKVEVEVKWSPNVDYEHVAETPDILLDVSTEDNIAFKFLQLSEKFSNSDVSSRIKDGANNEIKIENGNSFSFPTWISDSKTDIYKSVLVFTKSLNEKEKAIGDLNTEEILVKIVESRHWSNDLDKREEETIIGTEIFSEKHDENTPHNGFLFKLDTSPTTMYNINTYDQATMQGQLFAVNTEKYPKDGKSDLVVAWYKKYYDINTYFPYTTVRYTPRFPTEEDSDRIVIASRFGSDSLSEIEAYSTDELNISIKLDPKDSIFKNVKMTSYFNNDVIYNITNGYYDLIDNSLSSFANVRFFTSDIDSFGLPFGGYFASSEYHKDIHFDYSDNSGSNAIKYEKTSQTPTIIDLTINQENDVYNYVHVYATSTNINQVTNDAKLSLKLYYSDGSTETTDPQEMRNWHDPLDQETYDNYYLQKNLSYFYDDALIDSADRNIYGYRFNSNSEKTLQKIEIIPNVTGENARIFVFGIALQKNNGIGDNRTLFSIGALFNGYKNNLQAYVTTISGDKSKIKLNLVSPKNRNKHVFAEFDIDTSDLFGTLTLNFSKNQNQINLYDTSNNLIESKTNIELPSYFRGKLNVGQTGEKTYTVLGTENFNGEIDVTISDTNKIEHGEQIFFDKNIYSDVKVYNQPDKTSEGFNPNEEHALVTGSFKYSYLTAKPDAIYAFTKEFNKNDVSKEDYTSKRFVLGQFYNNNLNKYEMSLYSIQREDANTKDNHYSYKLDKNSDGVIDEKDGDDSFKYIFEYPVYAGDVLVAPYPLNEVIGANQIREIRGENISKIKAYWKDKNSNSWIVAGNGEVKAYFWYPMLKEFWHPTAKEGDIIPFSATTTTTSNLTAYSKNQSEYFISDSVNYMKFRDETPVTYKSYWKTGIPELRIGETLTFQGGEERKDNPQIDGLPSAVGWASAEVVFDSMNESGDLKAFDQNFSVRIVPAVREIAVEFNEEFPEKMLPATGFTESIGGNYFFKELHSSLKDRIYYDPILKKIYFRGKLNNLFAGDPKLTASPGSYNYTLQQNIMSIDDLKALTSLTNINNDLKIAFYRLYAFSNNPILTKTEVEAITDEATAISRANKYHVGLNRFLRDKENKLLVVDENDETSIQEKLTSNLKYEDINQSIGFVDTSELPMFYTIEDAILKNNLNNGQKLVKLKENEGFIPNSELGTGLAVFTNPNLISDENFTKSYVVIAENNDPSLTGNPVSLHIFKVNNRLYRGQIQTIFSENVFDEKITLRHTGDFGGNFNDLIFEWYYRPTDDKETPPYIYADPSCSKEILSTETEITGWKMFTEDRTLPSDYENGQGRYELVFGKKTGSEILVDNSFYVRYRHKDSNSSDIKSWSGWAGSGGNNPCSEPTPVFKSQLVKGWVKRVTDKVNIFDARISDFTGDAPATYVSVIEQIGTPYNGAVALNPDKNVIENYGMAEIYQTVLERAKDLSIDAQQPDSNDGVIQAIQNASSRIAQFYTILGNEAYTDALDPTIGFTTSSGEYGNLAPNIFTFMNQLATLSEEELTLLRGKSGSVEGDTGASPTHNRLIWNFSNGDGESAYAVSYNISDKNKNGFIDYEDAKIMYPQGHGDAWGHYLTALKVYYDLLNHKEFSWVARAENYEIDGQTFKIDYLDERRFAEAAAYKAKTGYEILDLTYRSRYVESPSGQYQGYKDIETYRAWGVDGWTRRSHIGSYIDWAVANAIIPVEDLNNTGISKIDRTTVPELQDISLNGNKILTKIREINDGLNPIGLLTDTVPFDVTPSLDKTHFEQIYERAINALVNAKNVFNYANDLKHRIREVADSQAEFEQQVEDINREYNNKLIDYFGVPYKGTIGAGKTYPEGYSGPDTHYYNYIDVTAITGESFPIQDVNLELEYNKSEYNTTLANDTIGEIGTLNYPLTTNSNYMYVAPDDWGERKYQGLLQDALIEVVKADADMQLAYVTYTGLVGDIQTVLDQIQIQKDLRDRQIEIIDIRLGVTSTFLIESFILNELILLGERTSETIKETHSESIETLPRIVGMSNDTTSTARAVILMSQRMQIEVMNRLLFAERMSLASVEAGQTLFEIGMEREVLKADFDAEIKNLLWEVEALFVSEPTHRLNLFKARETVRQALQKYLTLYGTALSIQEEREVFNKRVASRTQADRYKDLAFRINLNTASQKYREAFDLAVKYAYLSAKAYDYETNLSPDHSGSSQNFLEKIIQERTLGEVQTDGLSTTLVIGQGGLADTLATMKSNFDVLKTQMGFNNPQLEFAPLSLRKELFRIKDDSSNNWRKTLASHYVEDLWELPEFRTHMRTFTSEENGKQPALVIPFSSQIMYGKNFFGNKLGSGDHSYDPSHFATRIKSVGVWLEGYENLGLAETARAYLVPVGEDIMFVPNSDDLEIRSWSVKDQKIPVPIPMGTSNIDDNSWSPRDTLNGEVAIRKHSQLRVYHDSGEVEQSEMQMDSRLFGRSVWNTKWLLVIPGASLLNPPEEGLNTLINGVKSEDTDERDGNGISDIKIMFSTYSYSGN
jgi:predicted outer membrane repeat protein